MLRGERGAPWSKTAAVAAGAWVWAAVRDGVDAEAAVDARREPRPRASWEAGDEEEEDHSSKPPSPPEQAEEDLFPKWWW